MNAGKLIEKIRKLKVYWNADQDPSEAGYNMREDILKLLENPDSQTLKGDTI